MHTGSALVKKSVPFITILRLMSKDLGRYLKTKQKLECKIVQTISYGPSGIEQKGMT